MSEGVHPETEPPARGPRAFVATLAALALFGALALVPLQDVLRVGLDRAIPVYPDRADLRAGPGRPGQVWLLLTDAQWVAMGVARNARTLVSDPARLFDAETCHPAPHALTLGEPMISLGIVGIPFQLWSGDPIVVWNGVVATITWLSGLAMFLLVRSLTGSAAAGLVAGTLYAFLPPKTYNVVHLYVDNTMWTVLAFYFADAYFRKGRARDAIFTSLCAGMQISGSFYPFLAAVITALPFLGWLIMARGVGRLRPLPVLVVIATVGLFLFLVFAPYLTASSAEANKADSLYYFTWRIFEGSSGQVQLGWLLPVLAVAGLVLGRARTTGGQGSDPRWALLLGGVLCLMVSMGPHAGVDLFALLARGIPGLDQIRSPIAIYTGAYTILCVLAGFGAAGVIRLVPETRRRMAAGALVVLAVVTTPFVSPPTYPAPIVYEAVDVRPSAEALSVLEAIPPEGAVLDVASRVATSPGRSASIMLAAFHGKRTSVCHASFFPPERSEIERLIREIDRPGSIARLRALGFTSLLIRPNDPSTRNQR